MLTLHDLPLEICTTTVTPRNSEAAKRQTYQAAADLAWSMAYVQSTGLAHDPQAVAGIPECAV